MTTEPIRISPDAKVGAVRRDAGTTLEIQWTGKQGGKVAITHSQALALRDCLNEVLK